MCNAKIYNYFLNKTPDKKKIKWFFATQTSQNSFKLLWDISDRPNRAATAINR
jgi:hypothetical protein